MSVPLREGFTTGTAAAAAAHAAVFLLLRGELLHQAEVALPPFALHPEGLIPIEGRSLAVPVDQGGLLKDGAAWAAVVKDGGDDPDATHGARIIAYASPRPFDALSLPDGTAPVSGRVTAPGNGIPVYIYAGSGIGTATLPGLPVPVGEPAVNPEPRRQIAAAGRNAAKGHSGPLHILLCVPDGQERATHTLNARLGIVGGISILGTRGIVRPYSHEAWTGTIEQGLNVAAALGIREILLSTGRRSERLGFALQPDFPPQAGVQVADYAAFALRKAGDHPFSRLYWACFPGKLLKLAQGLEWTHAKAAASDIPLIGRLARDEGVPEKLIKDIESMPTAAGAFALLAAAGNGPHDRVLRRLAEMACACMRGWMKDAGQQAGHTQESALTLYVFSMQEKLLLSLQC